MSLTLVSLCSSDLLFFVRWAGWGDTWLLPAKGPSPLRAPFPGCSGGSAPFDSHSTTFREQDFGTGIVLHETLLCWYLQWLKFLGAYGVPLLVGAAVCTLWSCFGVMDGVGGEAGWWLCKCSVRKPGWGNFFIPRGDLYGYICSRLLGKNAVVALGTDRDTQASFIY